MADSLLSPAAGITMCAVSASALAYSIAKVRKDDLCEKKIPVISVVGAFIFAAQMINFTIPGTGSSGHIGGGVLLAAMLGSYPALLALSVVLIIQCLFFADGGLLALGCNIFNLAVIPCMLVYPLVFRPLLVKREPAQGSGKVKVPPCITAGRTGVASVVAAVVALQLGAFAVVLETLFSGIIELPFVTFLLLMQPVHLVIGIIEGIVTAALLCFVHKMRPEIMESTFERVAVKSSVSAKNVIIVLAVITLITGGVLSLFVSRHPDGLEWSIEKTAGTSELEINGSFLEKMASIQDKIAFMPDYVFANTSDRGSGKEEVWIGTTVAGLTGGALTFMLAGLSVLIISLVKRKHKKSNATPSA